MDLIRCVEIKAYNNENQLIYEQIFPYDVWHDEEKPIVDSDTERARLKVARVQGYRYNHQGRLTEQWVIAYNESGSLKEEWVTYEDGSIEHNTFK